MEAIDVAHNESADPTKDVTGHSLIRIMGIYHGHDMYKLMKETQFMDEDTAHRRYGVHLPTQHQSRQLQREKEEDLTIHNIGEEDDNNEDARKTSTTASEGTGRGKKGLSQGSKENDETTAQRYTQNCLTGMEAIAAMRYLEDQNKD
eukprot:4129779-Amphidinium_carterae.1